MSLIKLEEWYTTLMARADLVGPEPLKGSIIEAEIEARGGKWRVVVGPTGLYVDGWEQVAAMAPPGWPWMKLRRLNVLGPMPSGALRSYVRHQEDLLARQGRRH